MTKSSRLSLRSSVRGSTHCRQVHLTAKRICQARRAAKAEAKALPCWSAYLSMGLNDDSRLEKAAEDSTSYHPNFIEARHYSELRDHQTDHPAGADCALGGEDEGFTGEEEAKYAERVENWHRNRWRLRSMQINSGLWVFSGQSLSMAYTTLGITGLSRRRAISSNSEAAEKASKWLYLKRGG